MTESSEPAGETNRHLRTGRTAQKTLHEYLESGKKLCWKQLISLAKDLVSGSAVLAQQTRSSGTALGPLRSWQPNKMKEAVIQEAAQMANRDLDAYVASVRAYLARPHAWADGGVLSQSLKPKGSGQWQDGSAAEESRASPANASELAKKHCTKRSS